MGVAIISAPAWFLQYITGNNVAHGSKTATETWQTNLIDAALSSPYTITL
jgi:hypothetical protein